MAWTFYPSKALCVVIFASEASTRQMICDFGGVGGESVSIGQMENAGRSEQLDSGTLAHLLNFSQFLV